MNYVQAVAAAMRKCGTAFEHDWWDGEIVIKGCEITPDPECKWIWIQGSLRNDGLHALGVHYLRDESAATILNPKLEDETFTGRIWRLKPPDDFLQVCAEIADYSEKVHPYSPVSETFVNYSYTNPRNSRGTVATWEDAFRESLARYGGKRMIPGVFY